MQSHANADLIQLMGLAMKLETRDTDPHQIIRTEDGEDYLHRWWALRDSQLGCIYLHKFLRSDDDRALHDHPWDHLSVILEGRYREHTPEGIYLREPGQIIPREAEQLHRIELVDCPVWTLLITGERTRHWGFYTPEYGWMDHHAYLGTETEEEATQ